MNTMQKVTGMAGVMFIAAGMATGSAATAEAAPPAGMETRSVPVRYADLDLSREAGVRALYDRLRSAASRACGTFDNRDLAGRKYWQSCRDAALADAVGRLGNERVAALHQANQGRAFKPPQQIAVLK
jgi:UrcA family protein